jgi:hypothetical protein
MYFGELHFAAMVVNTMALKALVNCFELVDSGQNRNQRETYLRVAAN